jgi:basic membrane protein A and related proteins
MKRMTTTIAAIAALSLLAVACGDDDDGGGAAATTAGAATTTAGETTDTEATIPATDASTEGSGTGGAMDLDTNGDGKVVIGVATPGPRNDGAYYQALVDGVTKFSTDNQYEDPIIVDNIKPEEAATQLDGLARQNVDMIAVGAGEIADPLPDLTAKYGDVIWYCNCGGGFQELPNLIQSGDDGSEIGFSAGYATGLLMKAKGVTKAAMIGNNNFNFEKESFGAFRLGLDQVDPSYEWTYVATGSFNDVAAATEAFNNLKAQGVGAIYPYLGGSHEAVVKLSNENDVITMSAGAANACERTDLDYQIAVKFDAGQYVATILDEIQSGDLQRGETRVFHVGVDDSVGAVVCEPTAEQETQMEEMLAKIAAGDFTAEFDKNRTEAYAS